MKKLFGRLFISILSVSLLVLFFVLFFIGIFYVRASKQWSNNSFDEFSNKFALCLAEDNESPNLKNVISNALDCALEDNRISGLIFRDAEGRIVYSLGKTQLGDILSHRDMPLDGRERPMDMNFLHNTRFEIGGIETNSYRTVVTNSPLSLIQTKTLEDQLLVDLIKINENRSAFEKRKIEVPLEVDAKSITGSVIIIDNDEFSYAIDVLVFTPSTYKNSKDIFSVGLIWLISIILIALQFSLVLSYHFSRQLENYAKGLRKALFQLSKGKENVDLPHYNVEEYQQINQAVQLLDKDLSQNRKNRKAWLRNITHDLNTPVTSMQILLDGIEDKIFPLNEDTISLLKKEHTDLSTRIKRVVLYASLQSPDKQIYISVCRTQDIISSVKKAIGDVERIKFIEFDKEIVAEFSSIVLAITCLVENAIQYGTGEVLVEISKNQVKVINKGTILNDISIFEPWERGDKGRTQGGNGLGLPIAHEVMRLHNGKISLAQVDDKVVALLKWSAKV